ncbi:MAG: acetate--CoA ligase [Candidatus Lokiarchaeota archaeon]|nr:acetate--CoA ligase [Candidatus Lokiarchaeota archaeon]MBD3201400.1 acetate--CoA ligase [Candidatus Lokiarchaeota archaeon]
MSDNKNLEKYKKLHNLSLTDPGKFWTPIAENIHWYKKWDEVLDDSNPPFYKWFVGGVTNTCYNAVDRWAEKFPDKPAYIWYSSELDEERILTYKQLYQEVNRFASVLRDLGVEKGDRIVIYLPMIPEAAIAMLACVRIGAIHSVVFAGFSVRSLGVRIDDSEPKLLICADGGVRGGKKVDLKSIVDEALTSSEYKVPNSIVVNRGLVEHKMVDGRDLYWDELMSKKEKDVIIEPEKMNSTDPSYILYTSGTTGKPKGVVRDTGGHLVALYHSMKSIFNTDTDQTYFATSDIGWVVGHSYIIYGPLFKGCTSIIYEGTPIYPEPNAWFKVIEKYKVNTVFSAPTAFRILRKFDEKYITENDLSSLNTIYLAGEPLDEATYEWMKRVLGEDIAIVDNYWQTETGWPILANPYGIAPLKIKPGSPTKPMWGWNLKVVDFEGNEVQKGTKGYLVAIPPTPPAVLLTVYRNDERYINSYYKAFSGHDYYATGDYGIEDEDGYFYVLGRADEVIKVAGHRLGTGEMEAVFSTHAQVAEVSCIGVEDDVKGEVPIAMVVLKQGYEGSPELEQEMKQLVRNEIGPVATPKAVYFVKALPKTRSGKVIRRAIKNLAEGKEPGDLSTIEDPSTIDKIKKILEEANQ